MDRNEVEKSQLVSRWWNRNVIADNSTLPLRLIAELTHNFDHFMQWFYTIEDGDSREESVLTRELAIHGLKNVVFGKLRINVTEWAVLQRALKKLQILFKNNGRKLECINVRFEFWPTNTYNDFEKSIKV